MSRTLARMLVACSRWIVPEESRDEWRREWRAEIDTLAASGGSAWRFALGAPRHAWALRRAAWSPASALADVRFGVRWLRRRPWFTVASIATLALGIGATTGMFSVVYGVLLKPLPYREPDRLVQLYETNPLFNWTEAAVAPGNVISWRERTRTLDGIAWYMASSTRASGLSSVTLAGDDPSRAQALAVSANFFDVLGVAAARGRTFLDGEDTPGRHRVIVLSHEFWRRQFGADPAAVGRSLTLNGIAHEVIGVLPAGFQFDRRETDFFIPLPARVDDLRAVRVPHIFRAVARLKPEATLATAQTDLSAIAADLEREFPKSNKQMGVGLAPIDDWFVGPSRRPLTLFLAAVGLVLLMACANVAGLLLSRADERRREMDVRAALGASRRRLIRQLLIESMIVAAIGTALGVAIGAAGVRLFLDQAPAGLPRVDDIGLNGAVVVFAAGLAVLTMAVIGLVPALQAARRDVRLGSGVRIAGGPQPLRRLLVAAEVAIAVVLLVGTFLSARSFGALVSRDPGFEIAGLTTVRVSLPAQPYGNDGRASSFYEEVLSRLRARPAVKDAGAASVLPLDGAGWTGELFIENQPGVHFRELRHRSITSGYVETMGLRLIAGRSIAASDRDGAELVVVINETMARRFFANQNPVGQRVAFDPPSPAVRWRRIVGVVSDEPQESLGTPILPEVYDAEGQEEFRELAIVVRSGLPAADAIAEIRRAVRDVDPALALFDAATFEERVGRSVARPRVAAALVSAFGAIALVLAGVGIYGVAASAVASRAREIGVRLTFGATTADVLRLLLRQELSVVVIGLAIGGVIAALAAGVVSAMLYGVSAHDPVSYTAAAIALLGVAIAALVVPARRALGVDPAVTLRNE
ncbi:MAG TPA: ABC transporter permease [Vicinamibacterales bacterium]|nr:ABC transporter permease [Vicinamibacterales bacterium]